MKQKKYFVVINGLESEIEYREPFYPSEQGFDTYAEANGAVVTYFTAQAEKFFDAAASVAALTEVQYFQS